VGYDQKCWQPKTTIMKITHIDTACTLIQIGDFTIMTDPTLDDPGKYYHHGWGTVSKKTSTPQIDLENLKVDLVLLSHPQHKDNFDLKGQAFSKNVPLILSTMQIEKRWNNGKGMRPWDQHLVELPNGSTLKITATPAQHHPGWLPKFFAGHVIGFVIENSTNEHVIYISGDTVYFKGIDEVAKRFSNITIGLIHVGGVQFKYLTANGKYTMDANGFLKTIQTIQPTIAIPIHNDGWTHFKENDEGVKRILKINSIQSKVIFLKKGCETTF